MFEAISKRFAQIAGRVWQRPKITAASIDAALGEIRTALLAADVAIGVVSDFLAGIKEEALGVQVTKGVTSGQEFVYIVYRKLVELMGGGPPAPGQTPAVAVLRAERPPTVIVMAGLQGSGKTTTCGKLARYLRDKDGRTPLLVAADIHRPAAIDQLQVIGDQLSIPVWREDGRTAVQIAERGLAEARARNLDTAIIDTAGRLHIDEQMMREVRAIAGAVSPHEILLVCDAMTGQDAVRSARAFDEQLALTGVVLTKLDGDARGGAALSVKAVTGKPIRFVGVGEHLDRLEPFHADRMASRILGMGDVVSLVEKAREQVSAEEQERLLEKMVHDKFDLNDFLDQIERVQRMGSFKDILGMVPGLGHQLDGLPDSEEEIKGAKAIVQSMTRAERGSPEILNTSRRERIARGSGRAMSEVNDLLGQFKQLRKIVGQFSEAGGKGPFGKLKSLANLKKMMRPERLSELMHSMLSDGKRPAAKAAAKPEIDREALRKKRKEERRRKKRGR
ncbi:MAG TPA: signal recognition particle protein [Planctomycetes bacterium]|nr:signal recognition particle protein [Planctomycetota bacterium]